MVNVKLSYYREEELKVLSLSLFFSPLRIEGHLVQQQKDNGPTSADPTIRQLFFREYMTPLSK
jgi:hypothetical protein